MSDIELLADLPPVKKTRGRPIDPAVIEFRQKLQEFPGMWAAYPRPISIHTARTLVGLINGGYHNVWRGFEAASRDGICYIRWPES